MREMLRRSAAALTAALRAAAGAMLIAVTAHNTLGYVIAFVAAAFAAANVVGGYVVTGRMLKMFHRRPTAPPPAAGANGAGPKEPSA